MVQQLTRPNEITHRDWIACVVCGDRTIAGDDGLCPACDLGRMEAEEQALRSQYPEFFPALVADR